MTGRKRGKNKEGGNRENLVHVPPRREEGEKCVGGGGKGAQVAKGESRTTPFLPPYAL